MMAVITRERFRSYVRMYLSSQRGWEAHLTPHRLRKMLERRGISVKPAALAVCFRYDMPESVLVNGVEWRLAAVERRNSNRKIYIYRRARAAK